jgi:hypothetical protein
MSDPVNDSIRGLQSAYDVAVTIQDEPSDLLIVAAAILLVGAEVTTLQQVLVNAIDALAEQVVIVGKRIDMIDIGVGE